MNLDMRLTPETIEIIIRLHFTFEVGPDQLGQDKVYFWLTTKNLNLGGTSPLMLINRGRAHKVLEFINNARLAD